MSTPETTPSASPRATPRARPRRDRQRNRAALITAAFSVFQVDGPEAPLDAIAKAAGVSNATLYRHFPTRTELNRAVLRQTLERNAVALADAEAAETAWIGFSTYLEWLFAEQLRNPAHLSVMRALPAGHDPEIDDLRDDADRRVEALLRGAQAEGRVRADRYLEDVYLVLFLNERFVGARLSAPQAASDRFRTLVLDAFTLRPPSVAGASQPPEIALLGATLGRELAGLPPRAPGVPPLPRPTSDR